MKQQLFFNFKGIVTKIPSFSLVGVFLYRIIKNMKNYSKSEEKKIDNIDHSICDSKADILKVESDNVSTVVKESYV